MAASILEKGAYRLWLIAGSLRGRWRRFWWRCLGARIGTGNQIGNIFISFPAGVEIGDECRIEDGVRFQLYRPYSGSAITVGARTFIGSGTQINVNEAFRLGNDCLIAADCVFSDANHRFADRERPINSQGCRYEGIEVRDDVWIGCGVRVLSGVTIHRGAVVAAGAVVNRDVPAYEVWGGVPAKKIKERKK